VTPSARNSNAGSGEASRSGGAAGKKEAIAEWKKITARKMNLSKELHQLNI
jgi:hypothetical protein